ncbi:MAG: VOC family protein [Pseudomonadales bacterium]
MQSEAIIVNDITVNWFEIPVTDLARASSFYATLLGRAMGTMDGPDGPMHVFPGAQGPSGALARGERKPTADGVAIFLNCPDLDAALRRCQGAGGQVAQPKTSIGPFGTIAVIVDPDGNRIGLHHGG